MMERTFIMIKPDGVKRNLIGEVVRRIEEASLRIAAMKMIMVDKSLAEKHYAEHVGKPFYDSLMEYITSGHVVPMVVEGENAISRMRTLMGATPTSGRASRRTWCTAPIPPRRRRGRLASFSGKTRYSAKQGDCSSLSMCY
jgi:nucleoside diphosphate kinase